MEMKDEVLVGQESMHEEVEEKKDELIEDEDV
jgi:hypothetical protein